jgi:hypothetical protein
VVPSGKGTFMFRSKLWHKATLLLLAACLVASSASAGDLRVQAPRSPFVESFGPERILEWLAERLNGFWEKNGAGFDPWGLHATPPPPTVPGDTSSASPTPSQGDNGAEFDPFG